MQATFAIKDVKTTRLPELTRDFLEETFAVSTPESFDELIGVVPGTPAGIHAAAIGPQASAGEDRECRDVGTAARHAPEAGPQDAPAHK